MASLVAQLVKNLLAAQETQVLSLGWEDRSPGERNSATHSSILAWKISWAEEPGVPQSMWSQKSWRRLRTHAPDFPTTLQAGNYN